MKLNLNSKLGGGLGKAAAGQAASYATRRYVGENKAVDIRLGVAMLKDARVPLQTKLLSLAVGFGAIFVLDTLELPLEALIAVLLPYVGIGLNLVGDAAQFLVGSVLIAAAIAPRLAPKALVERIRAEREPVRVPVEMHSRPR